MKLIVSNRVWKAVFLTCLFAACQTGFAQKAETKPNGKADKKTELRRQLELAKEYARRQDWPKAVDTYKPLAGEATLIAQIYPGYLQALLESKDLDGAIKYVRRVYKATDKPEYMAQIGLLYKEQGKAKDAAKAYKQALEDCHRPDEAVILAAFYQQRKELPQAEACLKRARQLAGDEQRYTYELAMLYKQMGDTDKMLDELFALADRDPTTLQEVQGMLQTALDDKKDVDVFERRLLAKAAQHPESDTYAQLLYWFALQQKDWQGAALQARALDRRGGRQAYPATSMQTAGAARNAGDATAAGEIYTWIEQTYPGHPAAFAAERSRLEMQYEQLHHTYPLDKSLARSLARQYKALAQRGNAAGNTQDAELLRRQANILGFMLDAPDTAIALLSQAIDRGRYDPALVAQAKLDQADLYLLDGQPWESTLLYSQVEKDNKESPVGHEAKLRNARLSFFKGEFKLAQEHLDVLKQATSREIANDAMQLSLMISDNLVFDTTGQALKVYARADLLAMRNKTDDAIATLDSIPALFTGHSLLDDVAWREAQLYLQTRRYAKAAAQLEVIEKQYKDGIFGDKALFALAQIADPAQPQGQPDKDRAMQLYEQLLKDFPGSVYVTEARKRYRALRGDAL